MILVYLLFCLTVFRNDTGCTINFRKFIIDTLMIVICPLIAIRYYLNSIGSREQEKFLLYNSMADTYNFMGFGSASIFGIFLLIPYNYDCYVNVTPNFFNFHLLIMYGVGKAMIMFLIFSVLIMCSPFIIYAYISLYRQRH